jgi:hypothetical protein
MRRAKTKPPVRKPVFDEEGALRFAATALNEASDAGHASGGDPGEDSPDRKSAKKSVPDRTSLTLMLKSEVISRLAAEAGRKEKTVDQIVEKLVTKHLGKH